MADMTAQVLHLNQDDETVLQYLGAAVVLQWQSLSEEARTAILQQADSVGGLPPVNSLHERVKSLVARTRS